MFTSHALEMHVTLEIKLKIDVKEQVSENIWPLLKRLTLPLCWTVWPFTLLWTVSAMMLLAFGGTESLKDN